MAAIPLNEYVSFELGFSFLGDRVSSGTLGSSGCVCRGLDVREWLYWQRSTYVCRRSNQRMVLRKMDALDVVWMNYSHHRFTK